ncbi:MAG: primosomal protein N' [Clostridia bacterium]
MVYKVIVDISNSEVDRVFDYSGSDGIEIGTRVYVPFGSRVIEGFVVDKAETTTYTKKELKQIIGVIDNYPVILPEMFKLCKYMQSKYHLRMVDCLRLFLPSQMRKSKIKALTKKSARLVVEKQEALKVIRGKAINQRKIIEQLDSDGELLVESLNSLYGNSAVKTLCKKGIIEIFEININRRPYGTVDGVDETHQMTDKQNECIDNILKDREDIFLLHGVTGSGKTEVYMAVIKKIVSEGKTAIMLVPEISLTPNMMRLFRNRFGESVALLHSGLSAGERYDEWRRLRDGSAKIAIGARSAIFAPLVNIGIIIIDEEHDGSYQSDNNPRYNTFDIANFRREQNECGLVLGSATPSLDSYYSALQGKIKLLTMSERINQKPMPKVELVDMTDERLRGNKGFLSNRLIEELQKTITEGNQAILFLNRRGYSSFVICSKCGYVAKCTDCDVSLYYHKDENVLKCHYCGKKYRMFDLCPNCKSEYIRQGKIGTEQVVALLNKMFPQVNILRMDYDTTQTKESHVKILKDFGDRKAQILVGTQMVTKGHDFPYVTLVGILEGDQSLYLSDYRSSERTFQLITQVSGRCGRKDLIGNVIMQTYTPGHFALKYAAAQDYVGFYKREINIREATKFPPFCTIVRILYSGLDSEKCIDCINSQYALIQELRENEKDEFVFLQKMRSPMARIENKFRFQILMRLESERADAIISKVFDIAQEHNKTVSVFVEINPQNMS